MEIEDNKLKTAYKTTVLIGIAMVASVVMYIVVAEVLRNSNPQWRGVAFSTKDALYDYLRIALFALSIVFPIVIRILRGILLTPEKLADPAPTLISYSIIIFALCESPAIYGLVLFLLAGNIMDMYIFAAISLALFALFFPRYSRWTELANARSGAPTFE